MISREARLDQIINDLKEIGYQDDKVLANSMIQLDTLERLIKLEHVGLCDGGCIALSDLPPCVGCCVSSSPAKFDPSELVINPIRK